MNGIENPRILIVDDEPDILEFLSFNLKREGFKIYKLTMGYRYFCRRSNYRCIYSKTP